MEQLSTHQNRRRRTTMGAAGARARRGRRLASLVLALVVAGGFGACGKTSADKGGSEGSKALTVGFVELHADTFFGNIDKGMKQALGADGKVVAVNYDSDAGRESQAYEDLISRQVDAIVTSPLDPKGSVAGIRRAEEAGIPVICVNTCLDEADQAKYTKGFVLSDNAALGAETGRQAAKYIKDKLGGKATIAVLHCDIFDVCKLRKRNFFAQLKRAGVSYTIAAQQQAYEPDKAVPAAEGILTAHPDVNVFWAGNDGAIVGEVKAIQAAAGSKAKVFGTDMSSAVGEALLSPADILQTTTGQDGIANGKKAIEVVRAALADKPVKPATQLVSVVGFNRSQPATVRQWLAENK